MFDDTKASLRRTARFAQILGIVVRHRVRWKHPFYLCHLVTGRCNCRCDSCYWRRNRPGELTTEEVVKLYQDARASGFIANLIWGGEPLMRADLGDILRCSHQVGFLTTVITNGYFLDQRMDELAPYTDSFIISIDYPGDKHDEIRKCPGLFERAVDSIHRLKRDHPRVKPVINCLLTNLNKNAMPEMARFCQELGVSLYVCPMSLWEQPIEMAGGEEKVATKAVEPVEAAAWRQLYDLKKKGHRINNSLTYLKFMQTSPRRYRCHFPKIILQVDPWGGIVDCTDWSYYANVRDLPFDEILKHQRTQDLGGPVGESCYMCNNPNRIEMSWFWELRSEPVRTVAKLYFQS